MNRYSFSVAPAPAISGSCHVLIEGENLFVGADDFEKRFGVISSLEHDLLRISGSVFAADRASPRGEREEYRRHITMRIPIVNYDSIAQLEPILNRLLRRLSNDIWVLNFVPVEATRKYGQDCGHADWEGDALLFSGGLDSLAGALQFGSTDNPLFLSSHVTRNPATDGAQRELVAEMLQRGFNVEHSQFFVSSRDGGPTRLSHQTEPSQRTRSIVFLTLGALAARRARRLRVLYMAENGQMAIHLPLSAARIGAFSTHTAHPSVLSAAQTFFRETLGFPLEIVNPYVYMTKAQVVEVVATRAPDLIPLSTSCWKNARPMKGGARHCGECVPCIVRKIAIESHLRDQTAYARDLFAEDIRSLRPEDEGRRNLVEIGEFVSNFAKADRALTDEYPELISPDFDSDSAIAMYRRFSDETKAVTESRANLSWLIRT